jgi:hypothetical protein
MTSSILDSRRPCDSTVFVHARRRPNKNNESIKVLETNISTVFRIPFLWTATDKRGSRLDGSERPASNPSNTWTTRSSLVLFHSRDLDLGTSGQCQHHEGT